MSVASLHRLPGAAGSPVAQHWRAFGRPLPEGVADLRPRLANAVVAKGGAEARRLNLVRELALQLVSNGDPCIERRVFGFAAGIGCRNGRGVAARVLFEIYACGTQSRR